jgi:hypothetical protein
MSFLKKKPIPHGRFTYRGIDEFKGMSLQLRIEPSGTGVMVINANTVLHLNQTASAYAYYFMLGLPDKEVINKIRHMYSVKTEAAKEDYEKLIYTVSTLWRKRKSPSYLPCNRKEEPFSHQYSAPFAWIWLDI